MADHDAPKGTEDGFRPWEPEWIWLELELDDYTLAERDEQRWRLIDDLKRQGMLDPWLRTVLERPEAVGGYGAPEIGWLRLMIKQYHEGVFELADVIAEIDGRVDR